MRAGPVLLVEDDPDIQENLRLLLEMEGFVVQSAFNGREALDYLRAGGPACVILLDLMMPVMEGSEFLAEYCRDGAPGAPVIVLSAAPDLGKVAGEYKLRFVKKPIDIDLLLKSIGQARGGA